MTTGRVFLVGAGPGDPGLLTLRAKELLDGADYVLYDQLLSPEVLRLIPAGTRADPVESLPGKHPERLHAIHARMVERARAGDSVVRLKSGDPMIFGRAGEETAALRAAGVPYEIVPGVTAALAAGAYLEIPLTHRLHSSMLTIVTGHECAAKGESGLDWANLAGNRGTLAFYMGVKALGQIAGNLVAHGKSADTPAAVIHRATWNRQRSVRGPLGTIAARAAEARIEAPAILIVGSVVGLRELEGWFEGKPLLGLRVLVTRPAHQAEELGRLLRERGAEPVYHPLVEIVPPADSGPLDRLIDALNGPSPGRPWLVFTSANGVGGFVRRIGERGCDLRTFGPARLAAIGRRTALALAGVGLQADLVGTEESNSEALLNPLREVVRGGAAFLCQAEEGREILLEGLRDVAAVEKVAVYRQRPIAIADGAAIPHDVDVVTLTSPQLCRLYLERCGAEAREKIAVGRLALAVNSPRSARVLEDAGCRARTVSPGADMASLVGAIAAGKRSTC